MPLEPCHRASLGFVDGGTGERRALDWAWASLGIVEKES